MPATTGILLAVYLGVVAATGLAWRRRAARDEASYFVADRSLSAWWGFLGLASLTTGGSTTVALAALVYTHGLAGIWLDLAGALGLLLLGAALAGRVRREGAVTLPEIIGRYYGPVARRVAGLLVLVSEIVWFALLIEATQVVLSAALGLDPIAAIVGSTAVFVLYTALGGQFAVVRTDGLQYGLMVLGIPGLALGFALARGGFARLPPEALSFPTSPSFGGAHVLSLLLLIGLPHLVGSDVYAKLLSCRDERAARRAALGAGLSKLFFGGAVAAIALCARAALPPASPIATLPRAVLAFVPAPLASLVVVCLVATMHSSADAVLLSASAVTVRDVAPGMRERWPAIAAARALAPIYAALGLALALALDRDVLETLKLGYSIFAAGLILPVLAALLLPPGAIPTPVAIAAMVCGGGLAAVLRFRPAPGGADPVIAGTAACLAVLAGGFALGRQARRGALP